jgi:MFS family permease
MFVMFLLQTVCSAQYAIHQNKSAGNAVIAFIFLFYGFYDIAFTPLIVSYTVEILPYPIRAKGFNIFNFVISLSLIFNQYVNPIALARIGWKYYIVYVVWILFEGVYCYLFVIETKNVSLPPPFPLPPFLLSSFPFPKLTNDFSQRTLEETAALFDGEQATANLAHTAAANAGVEHETASSSEDEKGGVHGDYVGNELRKA